MLSLFAVAVTVAEPAEAAVMTPVFASTLTTLVFELDQVTDELVTSLPFVSLLPEATNS